MEVKEVWRETDRLVSTSKQEGREWSTIDIGPETTKYLCFSSI